MTLLKATVGQLAMKIVFNNIIETSLIQSTRCGSSGRSLQFTKARFCSMTEEERPESQGRCGPAAVHRVRKLVSGGMDAKLHQRRSLLAQAKTEGDPEFQVTGEDAFRSEREMLLAAVAGLREAAEESRAAEAACFAPVKQVIEAHLKEYKEHMASEFRHALQREATAELRATARELRLLCCSPLVSTERREAADVPERGSSARPEPKAGDVAQLSRSDSLHQTLPSLRLANEIHEANEILLFVERPLL
eukprot:g30825.t1